jgi:hypothetical protein
MSEYKKESEIRKEATGKIRFNTIAKPAEYKGFGLTPPYSPERWEAMVLEDEKREIRIDMLIQIGLNNGLIV